MKRMNCWPTDEQELLLKAALFPEKQALPAWEKYLASHDLNDIEHACSHLLPLVYANIKQNHVCRSVYRYWWASNHLFLNRLKPLLELLAQKNIYPCLLKGGSLMLCCYSDPAQRVIGDIDLLVDRSQVKQTIDCLEKLGWALCFPIETLEDHLKTVHACHFKSKNNQCIDLHWLLSLRHIKSTTLAQVPYKTEKHFSAFLGGDVVMLCPEDRLFHILIHGISHEEQPLIRWVADATVILRHHSHFDWHYFLEKVKQARVYYIVKPALDYLHEVGFFILPKNVRSQLVFYRQPWLEKCRNLADGFRLKHTINYARLRWREYYYANHYRSFWSAISNYPAYLSKRWQCKSRLDFFKQLLQRALKHLMRK